MIPLRDNIPSRQAPIVNYLLIAICTGAFFAQLNDQTDGQDEMVEQYGMIPLRLAEPGQKVLLRDQQLVQDQFGRLHVREVQRVAVDPPFSAWWTLLTCVFLHGGWMHFLGNMWFLYIFGDNVEDRLGSLTYLLFYLGCGVLASLTHFVTNFHSTIPTIGASGAIAGVMGGYFWLFPHARVLTLVPILFIMQIMELPAQIFLGIWFLIQFFQGTFSITGVQAGGVAWWAHIGGFAAGLLIARHLYRMNRLRPPTAIILPR